jgi:hypothetical protein
MFVETISQDGLHEQYRAATDHPSGGEYMEYRGTAGLIRIGGQVG